MAMFGALVGAAIDRTDGDSGITGAIVGMVVQKTVSVVAPLAVTFAIGWAVQKAAGAAWEALPDFGGADAKEHKARD
jgi:hypothetical protein